MKSLRVPALVAAFMFFAFALAVMHFWPKYAVRQVEQVQRSVVESAERVAERAEQRRHQLRREAEEARRLKPGERCLSGKYIREIPDGFEDDPSQDWKCKPPRDL